MYTLLALKMQARWLSSVAALLLISMAAGACSRIDMSDAALVPIAGTSPPMVTMAARGPIPASAPEPAAVPAPLSNLPVVLPPSGPKVAEATEDAANSAADILTGYLVAGKDRSHIDGLDRNFQMLLVGFFSAMPEDIRASTRILSGYRSLAHQQILWDRAVKQHGSEAAARKWVAPVGRSHHNFGKAVDLQYTSPSAKKWAHDNAHKFGLSFPMSWENWHIEPQYSRKN